MTKMRKLAHAAILAAGFLATPLFVAACPANQARPFTSGPTALQPANANTKWAGPFAEWIVDGNGVGLQICTDSLANDGNPPPCFYDPVDPADPYTRQLSRGGEAFFFLADNTFSTTTATGAQAMDAVFVLGVESAFLSATPTPGFETQFQRLRTRINVGATGIYTVKTPWGKSRYVVDKLLPPGSGQNRSEISEPIDISFNSNSSVPGLVSPFLVADNKGSVDPQRYIGDGITPTTVTGSPCGENYVEVSATALDGVTPLDIGGNVPNAAGAVQRNVYRNNLFTVMGKLAPIAAVPLSIGSAYYTRNAGSTTVYVMADGSTSNSQQASASVVIGNQTFAMTKEGARFYGAVPTATSVQPHQSLSVTAQDPGRPSRPNTQTASLTDFVTISKAEARCSSVTGSRLCALTVDASTSDDGSEGEVTLTLDHSGDVLVNGTVLRQSAAVPAVVTVRSSAGGVAVRPVTLINQ
ncbi:MAG: hypothetical protein RIQ60_985 [Pseudomonadota bacterium]|jgi:hypothetical protein